MTVYPFIEAERAEQRTVRRACDLLEVSKTAFYQWVQHEPSKRELDDRALGKRIKEIHERSRGTYGAPRIHAELRRQGISTSRKRVARLMREQGLQGRRKRRFKRTTVAIPPRPRPPISSSGPSAPAPCRSTRSGARTSPT